jgi:NADH:ubiquinone oxidoreductase subunit E
VSKDRKLTVTVCVGSSCHIKGARDVIMRFNELLKKQKLEDVVELKGSFCMERCGEGINWQIDAVKTFKERIIKSIKSDI